MAQIPQHTNDTIRKLEPRRAQFRESQRKRREKLAAGRNHQINLFLSPEAIIRLDDMAKTMGTERHIIINALLERLDEVTIIEAVSPALLS